MRLENLLVMLSGVFVALSLRVRKWLKRPKQLSVNFQHGSDTSKINQTTLNLSVETEKED